MKNIPPSQAETSSISVALALGIVIAGTSIILQNTEKQEKEVIDQIKHSEIVEMRSLLSTPVIREKENFMDQSEIVLGKEYSINLGGKEVDLKFESDGSNLLVDGKNIRASVMGFLVTTTKVELAENQVIIYGKTRLGNGVSKYTKEEWEKSLETVLRGEKVSISVESGELFVDGSMDITD